MTIRARIIQSCWNAVCRGIIEPLDTGATWMNGRTRKQAGQLTLWHLGVEIDNGGAYNAVMETLYRETTEDGKWGL